MSMREPEPVPPGKGCHHAGCEFLAVKALWRFHGERQPTLSYLCQRHANAALRDSQEHLRNLKLLQLRDHFWGDQRDVGVPWPFPEDPPR